MKILMNFTMKYHLILLKFSKSCVLFLPLIFLSSCFTFNRGVDEELTANSKWAETRYNFFDYYDQRKHTEERDVYRFVSDSIDICVRKHERNREYVFTAGLLLPIIPCFVDSETDKTDFNFDVCINSKYKLDFKRILLISDDKDTIAPLIGTYSVLLDKRAQIFNIDRIKSNYIKGIYSYYFKIVSYKYGRFKYSTELIFKDIGVNNQKLTIPPLKLNKKQVYYFEDETHIMMR